MRKRRVDREVHTEGSQKAGFTEQGSQDGTFFIDGIETVPALGTLPERPRYLTLSDGQVLDRANPPKATRTLKGMEAANRADRTIINQDKADRSKRWSEGESGNVRPIIQALANKPERDKLQSICSELSNHKVLEDVHYGCGIDPIPMSEVAELLTAF